MTLRPVLLGMNNPLSSDPEFALYPHPPGCAGWNIAKYSGLSRQEYLDKFDRRNILSQAKWERREAIAAADSLREELADRTVVLLGVEVAAIMRLPVSYAPFIWRRTAEGGWWAGHPHPSGRCREWNDPLVRACAEIFLQELAT